jgi:hypothetical protein
MTAPTRTARRPVKTSKVWRGPDGSFVEGSREVPVDDLLNVIGTLLLCREPQCSTEKWVLTEDEPVPVDRYCEAHGSKLVPVSPDASSTDPAAGAKLRLNERVKQALVARRERAIENVRAQAQAAVDAATREAQTLARDMRGHLPSLAVTAGAMATGIAAVITLPLGITLAAAGVTGSVGTVAAYLAVWLVQQWQAQRVGAELVGRAGKKVRARARHLALGVLAASIWTATAALTGVDPATWPGVTILGAGALGGWMVNRTHWASLWATRRRLADLARIRGEETAAKLREEAERLAAEAAATPDEPTDDLIEAGRQMAARWAQISCSGTVPVGFLMARTWIVPEETREVTVPSANGAPERIGVEYAVESEPGALVGRVGMPAPLVAARTWLAAMLGKDPATVSLVDQPDGRPNRGVLLVTDGAPLGNDVEWAGPESIRHDSSGAMHGHVGRTIRGEDVFAPLWIPGQAGGGGTYGHSGGGKSVAIQVKLLNDLAGGIFSILHDGKGFLDYGDFAGVIPLGCTTEHRDVILRSYRAERQRREVHVAGRTRHDRHGRERPVGSAWNVRTDGPVMRAVFEEFHMNAADKAFIAALTEQIRLQRATAQMVNIATQGGGLADTSDSNLRGLLNMASLEIMRMPDASARLTGYSGEFPPSQLSTLPGMMLLIAAESLAIPMRGAFVHREDDDGSIFDYLFAPDGKPLLQAPALPKETVEVFEREGLMDLWRLGMGKGGLNRLLSDVATPDPTSTTVPAPAAGKRMPVADVILAVALAQPGCARSAIDTHRVWTVAAGWDKPPVPSSISRPAADLDRDGLIGRVDGAYSVTAKGKARAESAARALGLLAPATPTAADLEAQAEREAEMADPTG